MSEVSNLALARLHRPGHPGDRALVTERDSLDFVIDGRRLSDQIPDDVASCLGWGPPDWEAAVIAKLLPGGTPDFPPDRFALYICPECGDLDCGAVTAVIEHRGETILWRDFGWQNTYEASIHREQYAHLGPYRFEVAAYEAALRSDPISAPSGFGAPSV